MRSSTGSDIAPHIFSTAQGHYAFVATQPENEADALLALSAVEACPLNAIKSDGLEFDAEAIPAYHR
jgi:hypothetical protein